MGKEIIRKRTRSEMCAQIGISLDLLQRASFVLGEEWQESNADVLLCYVEHVALVVKQEIESVFRIATQLRDNYANEEDDGARPK
jgi:hypothetical protein